MKRLSLFTAALCLSLTAPSLASAAEASAECTMYSKLGSTSAEYMLPLTLQDFVNMMSGKDPELLLDMTKNFLSGLDGNDIGTLVALGDDARLAGEAAGEVAVAMLMSGQVTSASEVQSKMQSDCETIGFDTIIANRKNASKASASNITK